MVTTIQIKSLDKLLAKFDKMSKIDMLCEYFNCSREDIMEPYVPKELPKLSSDEMAVALAYREATEERKATVRLLLGLERG